MARYKVSWTKNGETYETEPMRSSAAAIFEARSIVSTEKPKTVVVLRDSEGIDHPDNAGKFFLDTIVK